MHKMFNFQASRFDVFRVHNKFNKYVLAAAATYVMFDDSRH